MGPLTYAIAAAAISGASLLLTWIAVRAGRQLNAEIGHVRAQLVEALARAAEAEAAEQLIRSCLTDEHARREEDVRSFRRQLLELRSGYDRMLRDLQRKHGIHGPLASRRIQ
jgi:hypothetical protein